MTIQHLPQTTAVAHRWALPAGLVALAVAATAALGVTHARDNDDHVGTVEFTRSQSLVQDAIDDALAANAALDVTRSQYLVQSAIDDALASRGATDYTKAQVLVQRAIDAALASS